MGKASLELVALVALLRSVTKGQRWATVTEEVLESGSASGLWEQKVAETLLPDPALSACYRQAQADVAAWSEAGLQMVSILDPVYPARLREIHQAPPFLFTAGDLRAEDPAIAVIGSRTATERGMGISAAIATALAEQEITVLSGLAAGIDTAAHAAALRAGGRTVAVIGTGITKTYPAANRALQQQIAATGLVLSQFWPDAPPQQHNFLMRNAVMSGYGRATLVVEAGENSGARAQARMAVEHGRPVLLTDQVVDATEWAKALTDRPSVFVVASVDDALKRIHQILDRDSKVVKLLRDLAGAAL